MEQITEGKEEMGQKKKTWERKREIERGGEIQWKRLSVGQKENGTKKGIERERERRERERGGYTM